LYSRFLRSTVESALCYTYRKPQTRETIVPYGGHI